jgi:N-methylhydantoinase A
MTSLARRLGIETVACAEGVLAVAVEEMARVVRRVSVERGVDPRGATLVAFGGAGPLHACAVAEAVGVSQVVAPAAAGVLAARGLVVAPERRDWSRSVLALLDKPEAIAIALGELASRAEDELPGATQTIVVDCRYVGQTHALPVPWCLDDGIAALAAEFHRVHEQRFGGGRPGQPIQAVTVRVAAERPMPAEVAAADPTVRTVPGPCALAMDGATCWVAEGWSATIHDSGAIHLRQGV